MIGMDSSADEQCSKLTYDLKTLYQHSFTHLARSNDQILAAVHRILINQNRQPGEALLPPPTGPVNPDVPEYIKSRLERVLDPEYRDPKNFPLRVGVNGFTFHFLECTERVAPFGESQDTADLVSYMNLMKSVFILEKIKQGDEYERKVNRRGDPMWISFMEELEERLRMKFQQYTLEEPEPTRLQAPTRAETITLFQDDFRLRFEHDRNDGEDGIPDISAQLKNEILHLTLASSARHQTQELGLVRMSPTLLQMQSLTMGRGGSTEKVKTTVDLETADLVPTWANLSNPGPTWKIRFKENKDQIGDNLTFAQCGDLYQFQQAATGFKVAFDNRCQDVKYRVFYSSEGFLSSKEVKQVVGKIQLWYSRKIDANASASTSTLPSPSSPHLQPPSFSSQQLPNPARSPGFGGLAPPSPGPIPPRATSWVSSASRLSIPMSITTATYSTTATSVSGAASIQAYLASQTTVDVCRDGATEVTKYEKPVEPFLVMLVHTDHKGRSARSLLGIRLDAKTEISKACKCRHESACVHAQIERAGAFRGKDLDAYRVPADGAGAGAWNLAALGLYQRARRAERASKLRWVQIAFGRPEERAEFVDKVARLKQIWANQCRLYDYERDQVRRETIVE